MLLVTEILSGVGKFYPVNKLFSELTQSLQEKKIF